MKIVQREHEPIQAFACNPVCLRLQTKKFYEMSKKPKTSLIKTIPLLSIIFENITF